MGVNVKKVYLFADGALKTKENVVIFSCFAKKKKIEMELNYYAPYHGHSQVDGHFGLGKMKLRNNAKDGPVCDAKMVQESFSQLKNTTATFIKIVECNLIVEKLLNIRKYFQWKLGEDGIVRCRERSGEGEWVQQGIEWHIEE